MAIDWSIVHVDPQPDGQRAVAYVDVKDGATVISRIAVQYTDAVEFKSEILRKTNMVKTAQEVKSTRTTEAEKALADLRVEQANKIAEQIIKGGA